MRSGKVKVWLGLGILVALLVGLTQVGIARLNEDCPDCNRAKELVKAEEKLESGPVKPTEKLEIKPAGKTEKIEYLLGELIVKYKDSVTKCAAYLYKNKIPFSQATTDNSNSLDGLYRKYKVKEVTPLFRSIPGKDSVASLAKLQQDEQKKFAAVKTKFSQRTKRAPKDAMLPSLYHTYLIKVPEDTDIKALVEAFSKDSHVEYATPNYLAEIQEVPNDPYYHSANSWGQGYDDLWALKIDKLNLEPAWDITKGEGVVVAVIDTGVDYNHPDIWDNIWVDPEIIPDRNGDGRIDLYDCDLNNNHHIEPEEIVPHMFGWNFAYNNKDPWDDHGHGTHCSGTIAAVGNNYKGIIGVAPEARIMNLKAFNLMGSACASCLAEPIVYAAEKGADILSNSWGFKNPMPSFPPIEEAVRYAYGLGCVVVFAAGNSNMNVALFSPQNMEETITVAATDHLDVRADFSNFGELLNVSAPGGESGPSCSDFLDQSILSLRAEGSDMYTFCGPTWYNAMVVGEKYYRARGTSMACPHAAGVCALIIAANPPNLTNEEVLQLLELSADDIGEPGFDIWTGYGRVNAYRAVAMSTVLVEAEITSPRRGEVFLLHGDPVPIIGTAAGQDFKQYQLFYKRGIPAGEWIPIGGPVFQPVTNGLLGTWIIEGLLPGPYVLKLEVTSISGFVFPDIVSVSIDNIKQITFSHDAYMPANWQNRIVWMEWRNGNWDIYFYDLSTGIEKRITTDPEMQRNPTIWENYIVWEDFRNDSGDIYFYDLSTGVEKRITTDPKMQTNPTIWGNYIVWQDYRNGNADIYLYDFSIGIEKRITTDPKDQEYPAIWGNYIVWQDKRHGNWDIYLYDISAEKEQRITTNNKDQYSPTIWENRIVWIDKRSGLFDIYLYDISTGVEKQITSPSSDPIQAKEKAVPAIWGNYIVWQDKRHGNWDIFLYDLSTGVESQITAYFGDDYLGGISGDYIVYTSRSSDVYVYMISEEEFSYSISGYVKDEYGYGICDVKISFYPLGEPVYTLCLSGAYYQTGFPTGVYTVVPSKEGYTFNPPSAKAYVDNENVENLNFTAIGLGNWSISGHIKDEFGIGVEDVTIWFSPVGRPTSTNFQGEYSQLGFVNGVYTVTPVKSGCAFEPAELEVHLENNNVENVNFTLASIIQRITTSPGEEWFPAIWEDYIVWMDNRNGKFDIYLYDLSTGKEKQITTDPAHQYYPAIWANYIVWQDYRHGNWDIYLYDLSTGIEKQITSEPHNAWSPAIWENYIVWQDCGYKPGLYLYNLSTGEERQLISGHLSGPAIWKNYIVWSEFRHGNSDIYLYDLKTSQERQITTDPNEQISPAIWENYIVWQDNRHGNWDIYLYDLNLGQEYQITDHFKQQINPQIWRNYIVWEDWRNFYIITCIPNYHPDIYLYDISTGQERRITYDWGYQKYPAINGGKIVWQDHRYDNPGGNADIYLYTILCIKGDINEDGRVNSADIAPFTAVLMGNDTNPRHICAADCNYDGKADTFDIAPFMALIGP